jgi:hypothetical protein
LNAEPRPAGVLASPLPLWLKTAHVAIIANLLIQMAYVSWQVFVVFRPPGHFGPAFGAALDLPFEHMVVRRLYAVEGWMAFLGLAFYLAITEMIPRMNRAR